LTIGGGVWGGKIVPAVTQVGRVKKREIVENHRRPRKSEKGRTMLRGQHRTKTDVLTKRAGKVGKNLMTGNIG